MPRMSRGRDRKLLIEIPVEVILFLLAQESLRTFFGGEINYWVEKENGSDVVLLDGMRHWSCCFFFFFFFLSANWFFSSEYIRIDKLGSWKCCV